MKQNGLKLEVKYQRLGAPVVVKSCRLQRGLERGKARASLASCLEGGRARETDRLDFHEFLDRAETRVLTKQTEESYERNITPARALAVSLATELSKVT